MVGIGAEVAPSNLPPEHEGEKGIEGQGAIVVVASDLGDGPASGTNGEPIVDHRHAAGGAQSDAITSRQHGNTELLAGDTAVHLHGDSLPV